MHGLLLAIQIVSAIALVIAVLLHAAKGEGLGGIGGAARLFTTPKGLESGLDRATWACAIIFLVSSLLLAILKG